MQNYTDARTVHYARVCQEFRSTEYTFQHDKLVYLVTYVPQKLSLLFC